MSYEYYEERTHRWKPQDFPTNTYVKLHEYNLGEFGQVTLKYCGTKLNILNRDIPKVIDMLTAAHHTAMHK